MYIGTFIFSKRALNCVACVRNVCVQCVHISVVYFDTLFKITHVCMYLYYFIAEILHTAPLWICKIRSSSIAVGGKQKIQC